MGGPLHRSRPQDEAVDYWRRQCKATFQYDRIGAKLIDDMGAESLMWGSDYPHGDGVWPNSDKFHQGTVCRRARRAGEDDHLHQRRQILRADQLENDGRRSSFSAIAHGRAPTLRPMKVRSPRRRY